MRKILILLLFVLNFFYSFSYWENVGNCDRIKVYNSKIIDFAIDKKNQFIYTIDQNNIINKYEYNSGTLLWSKKINPEIDTLNYKSNIFLSIDAKSYTIFSINTQLPNQFISVFDIDSGKKIDSLSFLAYYSNDSWNTSLPWKVFSNYLFESKIFLFYLNESNFHQSKPGINTFYSSGSIYFKTRKDTNFVNIVSLKSHYCSIFLITNDSLDKFFYQGQYSYVDNQGSKYEYRRDLLNGVFDINKKNFLKISEYSNWDKSKTDKDLPFSSGFFDNDDSNIYLLLKNEIYKYNLNDKELKIIKILDNYKTDQLMSLNKTINRDFFMVIKEDSLKIHCLNYLAGSFKVDSLNKIFLFKNSNEDLIVTDTLGNIFKIKYSEIFKNVSVVEPINNFSLISPNPASDFITISHSGLDAESIEIYNIFGEKISPRQTSSAIPQEGNLKIDISNLAPGVYFIKIGDKLEKIIKL